ncbi:MAG: hypothetical protein IT270_15065 [Saprospiraceae bacterium]|nr:hypothetical protein [Saprospiraceae bacterium]
MKRLYPHNLRDVSELSRLLELLLHTLEHSPLQTTLKALSYDTGIPESIFRRLAGLHRAQKPDPEVKAQDFYILFANILFRFPTVRIFRYNNGSIFFKL